jgi:hypothetical protein
MNDQVITKVEFASQAWIDAARNALEPLVAERGKAGQRFSLCEVFTNAPANIAASGTMAWHFYVDGTSVVVAAGDIDDATVRICTDYQGVLPQARQYYTDEILAQRATEAPGSNFDSVEGDLSLVPDYMVELHNQLSALTA